MSSNVVLKVSNVSKCYEIYEVPHHRLFQTLFRGRRQFYKEFWALRDISFDVKRGECVGIIGRNGAGKSTLLQIITGTLSPTLGEVEVNGRVSALLELGSGFNPEFTGKENVYMNGAILGLSKAEMNEKFDKIAAFADIGNFIEQPVKTYSSGMYVRLAFAVAIMIDPDILIVDEALAVGDMFFQAKCINKMKKMIDDGTTLLFVSHDTGTVKALCKKALLLDKGRAIFNGDASVAVEKYFGMKVESEQKVLDGKVLDKETKEKINAIPTMDCFKYNESFEKMASFQRIQNGKASFKSVALLDENENVITSVDYGQKVILRMAIEAYEDIHLMGYGYHIRDKNGVEAVYNDYDIAGQKCLEGIKAGDQFVIDWTFKATLCHGRYTIASGASIPINLELGQVDFCDFIPISCQFVMNVRKPSPMYGLVNLQNDVICRKITAENKMQ
jgi:lipopolysaccharide transport system ATP-binding protein